MVATRYTSAANAESRKGTGASSNRVAIWYADLEVAATANNAYTAISIRPGPVLVAGDASGTDTVPQLLQPEDDDRHRQGRHHQDGGAPPALLGQGPEQTQRKYQQRHHQIRDEDAQLVRCALDGEHDDRNDELDQKKHLDDSSPDDMRLARDLIAYHGVQAPRKPRPDRTIAWPRLGAMAWPTWRVAMEQALYGPDGFFRRERPADHFRT